MNTKALNSLAQLICAAQEQDRTPMGIAFAVDAAGRHMSPETAAELARLRAGVASAAALDGERLALIRRRRTHCEATRFETEAERPVHVWGPSQYPGRDMCQRCTTERAWAEDETADEVVLLAEVDRLRARVSELESERHVTNEALSDAAEALRGDRDRIAELEAERPTIVAARDEQIITWLGKKAREYGNSNAEKRAQAGAVARMADKLSRGAVRPLEDPHDSPLHHTHATGRDLPELTSRPDCPLGGLHLPGVPCDERCGEKAALLAKLDGFLRRPDMPEVPRG